MKVEQITASNIEIIRRELNAVLAKHGMDTNMTFNVGNIRYLEGSFTAKIEGVVQGMKSKNESALDRVLKTMNLKVDGIGGRKLIEFNSRASRYPFVYEEADGSRYKCSHSQAKVYFS